ncbi:hypothetical protein JYK22_13835, partial [Nonomuraea sp. RK-328]|nr:hypothetical protein [Nonomuraea sp. RK-328]
MTQPPDEYGDVLRRVLRAEADTAVPSPDGLEIIRARIERRGVRNLFWWRAGAAAASAVLVAGTIVMVIPELRHQVLRETVQDVRSTSTPPAGSSTTRAVSPEAPQRSEPREVVVVPDPTTRPPRHAPETARSTSKPTRSSTPSPTPCPSTAGGQAARGDDCPGVTPSPTPTPSATATDATPTAVACPADDCPTDEPQPTQPTQAVTTILDTNPIAPQ